MILENYLNENINYNQIKLNNMLLNENVTESIKKIWEKIKKAFFNFIQLIKRKWDQFKLKIKSKKESDKKADEVINKINELEKNGSDLSESVFSKMHQICCIKNFRYVLNDDRLDTDVLINYILKSNGIEFNDSILRSNDIRRISDELNRLNLDNINYMELQDSIIRILQSVMINSSYIQLYSNQSGMIDIKIDYEELYTLAHISNSNQVYVISNNASEDLDIYIKKYDQLYKEIYNISSEVRRIKIKQEKDTLLFKYYKLKLKITNDVIEILVRINERLQAFRKNNNLRLMDDNDHLITE